MGSGVSVRRDPDSAMKLKLSSGCKTNKVVIPSPVKDNRRHISETPPKSVHPSSTPSAATSRDLGSKDETFFDTQPWLESDGDDDFFSVNGDFTPSRGNTPVHKSIPAGNSVVGTTHFEDRAPKFIPTTSPANKKKKLAELFRDSSRGYADADGIISRDHSLSDGGKEGQETTVPGTGFRPVTRSEKTPNSDDAKPVKQRPVASVQCCLPSLTSTRGYSGSKNKTSPAHSRG